MIKYLLVLLLFCLNSFGCIKTAPFNSTLNLNDIKWKIIKEELESDFDNINLIRPVESDNLKKVEDFIVDSLDSVGWDTIRDKFTQNTVNGEKSFTNIIATLPSSEGTLDDDYFVLACHYESKMMENFYGSIDSAMPCAIILQIAKYISKLDHRKAKLKLFFFDGEEAFKEWTAEDSLYGSRYLADKLAKESFGDGNPPRNELSRIKLFILLDLIGGKKCEIPDYIIYQTNSYYSLLVDIETTATKLGLLTSEFSQSEKRHFGQTTRSMVSDDHIPFYNRGVPILHLIPTPFPFQWHTVQDNKSNNDFDESFDLLLIFAAFIQTIITE